MLIFIPARGGSKRLPAKNLQLWQGQPLVEAVATAAKELFPESRIVVSTDDETIAAVAGMCGAEVHRRDEVADGAQLDDLDMPAICAELDWNGPVLLWQPTAPPVYTVQTQAVAMTGKTEKSWKAGPLRWYPRPDHIGWDRTGPEWDKPDIDTFWDLQAAKPRPRLLVCVGGGGKDGWGHVMRQATLARHAWPDAHININGPPEAADQIGGDNGVGQPDLIVVDGCVSVMSEDIDSYTIPRLVFEAGSDRWHTATINALYKEIPYIFRNAPREFGGADWAVIRPEFLTARRHYREGDAVVGVFGYADPYDLMDRAALAVDGYTLRDDLAPGDRELAQRSSLKRPGVVAELFADARVVVTAAGRTVYEAACVGVPAVVVASNVKEMQHQHLGPHNGNLYAGPAWESETWRRVTELVERLRVDDKLWGDLRAAALGSVDGKGIGRIRSVAMQLVEYGRVL